MDKELITSSNNATTDDSDIKELEAAAGVGDIYPIKVAIVDDSRFMKELLKKVFNKNGGIEVVGEASNGIEAIDLFNRQQPEVMTLDITMDKMDGLEALKHIREANSDAIIVMCSAMGQQANVLEAINLGAIDFIVKPFTEDRVIEAITKSKQKYLQKSVTVGTDSAV